jgi:hypothetical protein
MDWIASTNLLGNFVFVHNRLLKILLCRSIKSDLLFLVQKFKSENVEGEYHMDDLSVDGNIILN